MHFYNEGYWKSLKNTFIFVGLIKNLIVLL